MRSTNITKHYTPLFVMPAFILFSLFFIIPNIAGLFLGFTDWSQYYPLQPSFNGLNNFKDMVKSSIFITAVKNTFSFAISTTLIKVVLGLLLAIVLNNSVKLKELYRTIIFSPVVVNPLVIALVFSALYNPTYGPINIFLKSVGLGFLQRNWLTDPGVAMGSIAAMEVWMGIGIIVVIFLSGLQTVPKEYYESAKIDGANETQQLLYITIPLIFQSLTICSILSLLRGIGVFAQVYGLTNGGPADATQVYGTFMFKSFGQGLYGFSAAAGLVFTIFVSLISFLLLGFFKKMEVEY